jgi:hypothetical protein
VTDRLPRYRVSTGPDDAAFCERVSAALELGHELYGGPAIAVDAATTVVAQAVVWGRADAPPLRGGTP